MKFQWVERSSNLSVFGPEHNSSQEAIKWAKNWKSSSIMSPEHAAIFLVEIENNLADIYRGHG